MFKNSSILVALAMVVAVAANVIPTAIQPRKDVQIVYEGNNMFIGERSGNDRPWFNGTGFQRGEEGQVVTTLSYLTMWDRTTYVEVYDRSPDPSLAATPALVLGEDGEWTKLVWTSQIGQSIYYEYVCWIEQ